MADHWILKILLSPLAFLYGLVIGVRNILYDAGLLRGVSFSLPVISIGNLSVGGTGKTPHTEYLVRSLHEYLKIGVLSRGYKRKTTGYLEVEAFHSAAQAGDEPLQYKRKFPDVSVAVSESRSVAIPLLVRSHPGTQVIILDDGFQHREVTPGLNILLTDHHNLFTRDWLLPVGRLREWRSASLRADAIIVTKCPAQLSEGDMNNMVREIDPSDKQEVFFSRYAYGNPYRMYNPEERITLDANLDVMVVAGIANTDYLMDYVESTCRNVLLLEFDDHHLFTEDDIRDIETQFRESDNKIILTTEKDAIRLNDHRLFLEQLNLPLFILPLRVQFLGNDPDAFDRYVKEWLLNFKR